MPNVPDYVLFDFFYKNIKNSKPEEIEEFFRKLQNEIKEKKLNIDFDVKKNIVRHQYKNSECGVYCLKFIADRLEKSFEEVVETKMPDDIIMEERWKRFFRVDTCRKMND